MKEQELISCNSEFSEFALQQLEERLETDPLAVGGLVDLSYTDNITPRCGINLCPNLVECGIN
ncbi:hypothetical protein B5F77_15000 [Parabacteroides sp. An277]|uniref:hypothetical protein n=1 Tax=Parabacteroides sp. An277 TaxID=1965619 RepID=UPI000B36EB7B|nr:hypothetical protein [Parabacteroides sp. An277]OUO49327.1 hypothetical protein B5F77_15000 [Parabacteroides sp. An277]